MILSNRNQASIFSCLSKDDAANAAENRIMLALWFSHLLLPLPTLSEEQALNYICRMKNEWRIILGFPGAESSHLRPTRTPEQRGAPSTAFKGPQWLREVPAEWGSGSCKVGLSHVLTSAAPRQRSLPQQASVQVAHWTCACRKEAAFGDDGS